MWQKARNERGGSMDKAMMLLGLLLIATPLVVLTLGIGWLMDDERMDKTKLRGDNNRNDLRDDCVHSSRGSVLNNKGEVPIRCGDRQNLGEMGTEEMKEMLRILI